MNEAEQTWPENNPHLAAFPRPSGLKPLASKQLRFDELKKVRFS
jgi:hypothetical protein